MAELNFNPEIVPESTSEESSENKVENEGGLESQTENKETIKENIDRSEQAVKNEVETPALKKKKASVVLQTNLNSEQAKQLKEIDNILSEGLEDVFLNLSKDKQAQFKQTGEETVAKINVLLEKTKIKVEQIVNLIKKWLGIIPNANYYYLEQESKIKADKIIKLKKHE
ncbi:MAG: hypothetical protein K9M44_01745 [Candidatus Pacebacteria bacterium]|nr:hypothetical protein [Candidatus Paceibacterota bacterium]